MNTRLITRACLLASLALVTIGIVFATDRANQTWDKTIACGLLAIGVAFFLSTRTFVMTFAQVQLDEWLEVGGILATAAAFFAQARFWNFSPTAACLLAAAICACSSILCRFVLVDFIKKVQYADMVAKQFEAELGGERPSKDDLMTAIQVAVQTGIQLGQAILIKQPSRAKSLDAGSDNKPARSTSRAKKP